MNIYRAIENCSDEGVKFGILSFVDQRSGLSAEFIISEFTWGTYGINGKNPLKYVKLVDCSTEHLNNILRTQPQITSLTTLVIMAILMAREND